MSDWDLKNLIDRIFSGTIFSDPAEDSTKNLPSDLTTEERLRQKNNINYKVLAAKKIAKDEGYSSKLTMNVPSDDSGITIAGVDLAKFSGDKNNFLKMLESFGNPDAAKLKGAFNLTGDAAKKFIKDNNIKISLNEEQINQIPLQTIDPYEEGIINKIGEDNYKKLPDEIKVPLLALTWLNLGPNSLKSMKQSIESGNKEDWKKTIYQYDNYWNRQSEHNRQRAKDVADAIRAYYFSK